MTLFFRVVLLAGAVGFLAGAAGCSGDRLNVVQGKVLHKDKPLAGALVTFHPKNVKDHTAVPSTGLTNEEGVFKLTTGKKEGAPPGEYVVTIICTQTPAPAAGAKKVFSLGGADESFDVLAGAYANREQSKITATVNAGDNQIPTFDLK